MEPSSEFDQLKDYFVKADAEAAILKQRQDAQQQSSPAYESLLSQYATTTAPLSARLGAGEGLIGLPRALDILRHEYLNCLYDMKLWKIRTNDDYPSRRIKAMEKFLKEFDESIK